MQSSGQRRFEALLSGVSQAAYDRPLLDRVDWLVVPTLGAVVPGWVLIIPRRQMLSFRDWATAADRPALSLLDEVTSHLKLQSDEVIWFEHGPAKAGTLVGCGLDQAHLHVLVRPRFSFDLFVDHVRAEANLDWTDVPATASYSGIPENLSYLVAGSGERAIRAIGVETAGSQFFRRVVAALDGTGAGWNYHNSPHMPNIERTIATFRQLENAARRGA